MKILLDECVPVQVRNALVGHEVSTAPEVGWSGISNGELLQRAEQNGFDLFIVADKNLGYQQNLKDSPRAPALLGTGEKSGQIVDEFSILLTLFVSRASRPTGLVLSTQGSAMREYQPRPASYMTPSRMNRERYSRSGRSCYAVAASPGHRPR